MNIVYAEYNKYHNSVDIGYILRIDCGKAELD